MTLTPFFRATCTCGIYRDIEAPTEAAAVLRLEGIGWDDGMCLKCVQTRDLKGATS
jgi:hypothetical protein